MSNGSIINIHYGINKTLKVNVHDKNISNVKLNGLAADENGNWVIGLATYENGELVINNSKDISISYDYKVQDVNKTFSREDTIFVLTMIKFSNTNENWL